MRFYVGMHHTSKAKHLDRCMISHNVLRERVSNFKVNEWLLDSGAFTQIEKHGEFQTSPEEYAEDVVRWSRCGDMHGAVTQDYMCEPFILDKCNATVEEHQRKTVDRYDTIRRHLPDSITLIPVLQGQTAEDYQRHVEMYGGRLTEKMWVGVGSVCKRNKSPADIEWVLSAIKDTRPDLRLHGFGIKTTALGRPQIRSLLWSADSMAWSYRARMNGGDANGVKEAQDFESEITNPKPSPLFSE